MKRLKDIAMRMIPVVIVFAVTLALSLSIYQDMMNDEKENCWSALSMATNDVAKEMNIRFSDNMNSLDLAADGIMMQADLNREESVIAYLTKIQKSTIFDRIDIIYPSGQILMQSGEHISDDDRTPYNLLLEKGAHLSHRKLDPHTNVETVYYFTHIGDKKDPSAILVGAVSCETLGNVFVSEHYQGQAQVFLIDRRNGDFLIDKWHDKLGNIYDLGKREVVDKYEGVDFIGEVMSGKNAEVAFISKTNNKVSYMSYMPLGDLDFSVSLFVQEDIIFKDVNALKTRFVYAGIIELIILLLYLVYNIYIVAFAVNNRARAEAAELEKEKNEAKSRFLSSVSHDIRTPLNGIIGMLEVIKLRGGVPARIEDSLHKIDVSARYLFTLASDVLDINELESGKVVFSSEPIDLCELVNDIGIIIEPRAKMRGISYDVDVSELKCPYVVGSGVHINKILMNILTNAVKYNRDNGEIHLCISDSKAKDGIGSYVFEVKDTGIGMSEEFQKSMFNAFEQEASGARTGQLGHGLGLSIVRRLVEKMGGTISVESKKNVGSTFTVTLPLAIDTSRRGSERSIACEDSLKGARILLVEDNELNMEIADAILAGVGAKVTHAVNGRRALDLFKNSSPYDFDVILMDLMMPEMDGYETTKAIRQLNDRPDAKEVPIIAMTASTFSEDVKKCKDVGMNGHIGKPLDLNTLVVRVAKELERFRALTK